MFSENKLSTESKFSDFISFMLKNQTNIKLNIEKSFLKRECCSELRLFR